MVCFLFNYFFIFFIFQFNLIENKNIENEKKKTCATRNSIFIFCIIFKKKNLIWVEPKTLFKLIIQFVV